MNQKISRLIELCTKSRSTGLTLDGHKEKINLFNELVEDGVMTHIDGQYNFVDNEVGEMFKKSVQGE